MQCLLVDDDVNMLNLLKEMVPWEKYGYEIMGAVQNGETAMKLLTVSMPDIIITDVKMPLMDGISLCANIRKLRKDIPIILLSAYECLETARLALKYNVMEYMIKPLTPQNIELLCQILFEVSLRRNQHSFFTEICSLPERQKEVLHHLKKNDSEYFQDFFAAFTDCASIAFQIVQTTCFILVRLLYTDYPNSDQFITEQNNAIKHCHTKLEMVSLVAELYSQRLHPEKSSLPNDYHKKLFEQLYDYTNQHFMLPDCGAPMLSDRFHFSPDHINRIFKRYTGETLNVYINEKRMSYALDLLQNPRITISEIASLSGFRNQNYFARVFRKNMQMSPTEYRLQLLLKTTKTGSIDHEKINETPH